MNAFDAIVRAATARSVPFRITPAGKTSADTKVGYLLYMMDCAAALSTVDLARATGLESRLVWGLLKAPRERGQVRFADGLWSLNHDYVEQQHDDVVRAAALLRSNGWSVEPPRTATRISGCVRVHGLLR